MGDAWINPLLQQSQDSAYAYSHGLIDQQSAIQVTKLYTNCARAINSSPATTSLVANRECGKISEYIMRQSGVDLHNLHNLPQSAAKSVRSYASLERYLNSSSVKHSLHVESSLKFSLWSTSVAKNFELGEQNSVEPLIAQLLERKIKVLIYNGLDDATDCNFMGTSLWLNDMNWGKFNQTEQKITYNTTGDIIGYTTSYKNLSFVRILSAGHMAAEDQAQNCLEVVQKFILN